MAWASCIWRRAARGKTRITTTRVCVFNPSVFLHDSGPHRGLLLPDPLGKRASCHLLGQEEQPRALDQARPNLPVQVCGHRDRLQEPEERGP
ncbi:hypothetical protein INR49_029849 [Caranx melampygus]|nr:hypothetical protein INR49_029849 [Caranx melampygus]